LESGEICNSLNKKKTEKSLQILESNYYGDFDIAFLQEVSASFVTHCSDRKMSEAFDILYPMNMDTDRDQNSFILLRKGRFTELQDETQEVIDEFPVNVEVPVVPGDLFVLSAVDKLDGQRYFQVIDYKYYSFF